MTTTDITAISGGVIVIKVAIQCFPWVAFIGGGGQVAEMLAAQITGIVARCTVKPAMISVGSGIRGVELARTGRMAAFAVTIDID